MSNTIELRVKGSAEDPAQVDASTLAIFLHRAVAALRAIESDVARPGGIAVLVTGLRVGSAVLTVEVRAKKHRKAPARATEIRDLFLMGSRALQLGTPFPKELGRTSLQRLSALADVLRQGVTEAVILDDSNADAIAITRDWATHAASAFGEQLAVSGQLRGHLEGIDLHGQRRFYIYPVLGDRRVECHFPTALLEQVKTALGQYVTVAGIMTYAPGGRWPNRIDADLIEVHRPAHELPPLRTLAGLLQGFTKGLSASDFLEQQRASAS